MSVVSSQEEKPMGAECPHGRIWPQVTRPCEIAGRRKAEEEKGDYSTSSLLRWAPALCWLPALRKWHRCLAGALAMVQCCTSTQGIHLTNPPGKPGRTRDWNKWEKRRTQPPTSPVTMPIPRRASGFCWRHSSMTCQLHRPSPAAAQKPGPSAAQNYLQSTHPL